MNLRKRIFVGLLCAIGLTTLNLFGAEKPDVVIHYKQIGSTNLDLLVLKPEGVDPTRPAFLYFHGGGWNNGDAEKSVGFLRFFRDAGFVCASAEYRRRDVNGGSTPMDATRDARSALRAFVAHAAELGFDTNKVVVGGGSAGGHLACMTALGAGLGEPEEEQTPAPTVSALLLWNPVVDTTDKGYGGTRRFGELTEKYSPVHLLRSNSAPVLVQHGDADQTVPYENAQRFVATAEKLGLNAKLVTYHGGRHSFTSGETNKAWLAQSYREAQAFLMPLNLWPAISVPVAATKVAGPQYFAAKPGSLAKAKAQLVAGDKEVARVVKRLLSEADELLTATPPSVMAKQKIPPSGDKHDYMSLAPYYWPNPNTKNHLPYVRHDGRVNPESRDVNANDSPRVSRMGDAVEALSLAYYFSGKEAYAAQASRYVHVWFLDPATRMNPNFQFAQAVLGQNDGRGTGILEARHIATAVDAVQLLSGSPAWTSNDQASLDKWVGTYLDWLLNSKPGQDERNAKNNHGSFYDVQAVELALSLGRTEVARRILEEAKQRRIAVQIEPDGRQPLELTRTKSLSYSGFNLEALATLANFGEYVGVDLWHYETADGRSISRGISFLLPYLQDPAKPWPFEQIKERHDAEFLSLLYPAAVASPSPELDRLIAKFPEAKSKQLSLLFAR